MIGHAVSIGNPCPARDHRPAHVRHGEDDLPEVLGGAEEENRSMPLGHVSAGRRGLELLARIVRMEGGRVV